MNLAERLLVLHAALDAAGLPHAFGGAFALAYATEHAEAGTADMDEALTWIDGLVGADSTNAVHLREAISLAAGT